MKKLRVTIMVLMLCTIGATASRAELVAGYAFEGNLNDCSGNGYDGIPYDGNPVYSGGYLYLDGVSSVEIPVPAAVFEGSTPFSIVAWFKTSVSEGGCIISCGPPGDNGDDHHMSVYINEDGAITYDNFWINATSTATDSLDGLTWHHYAVVYDGDLNFTLYIDGDVDAEDNWGALGLNTTNAVCLIGFTVNTEFPGELGNAHWDGGLDDVGIYDHALTESEVETIMEEGPCHLSHCCGSLIIIDPNVTTVYETGETQGDFDVSFCFPLLKQGEPNEGTSVTVDFLIDPDVGSGPNDDIILVGGSGPENQITFSRTAGDWDVPEVIIFKAIDDPIAEPPDLEEVREITISTSCAEEPNFNSERIVRITVVDNDQANILFQYGPPNNNTKKLPVTSPVKIWEEPGDFWGSPDIRWRKIWIHLQVQPSGGPVKLNAEIFSDVSNPPLTDPCLPYDLIFTAGNYNTPQAIKRWGNDDEVLQAIDATSEGDQYYQADLVFTVIDDGGDTRYTDMERTVQFNIEDNECGAFGISYLDVGNPNAFSDPNFRDEDGNPLPDCYIDIYDVVEMAIGWLRCTNPQDGNCWSML